MLIDIDVSILEVCDLGCFINDGLRSQFLPSKVIDEIDFQTEHSAIITIDDGVAMERGLI